MSENEMSVEGATLIIENAITVYVKEHPVTDAKEALGVYKAELTRLQEREREIFKIVGNCTAQSVEERIQELKHLFYRYLNQEKQSRKHLT